MGLTTTNQPPAKRFGQKENDVSTIEPTTKKYPGRTLGIWGFIIALTLVLSGADAFTVWPAALAMAIVALVKSTKAQHSNGLAVAAICICAGWAVLMMSGFDIAARLW